MTSMVRQDAREVHQLRRQGCEIAVLSRADGSASFTQGKTTVLASVFAHREVPIRKELIDRASVEVIWRSVGGGATVSDARCERIIQECVSSCLLLHEAPRSLHSVAIQVVEDDGSALACAVNALSLALLDAAIPMKHSFSASASAVSNSQIFLDPDLNEETTADGQVTAIFSSDGSMMLACEANGQFLPEKLEQAIAACQDAALNVKIFLNASIERRFSKELKMMK